MDSTLTTYKIHGYKVGDIIKLKKKKANDHLYYKVTKVINPRTVEIEPTKRK